MTTSQSQPMSAHLTHILGRTPQPLQFMRLTRMNVSRIWDRWFGRIYDQSGQKENLPSPCVPCHVSRFCCDSTYEKPLLPLQKEAGLMEGTHPGEHISLLQSHPAPGSGASRRPYRLTLRNFLELCLFENFTGR